MPTVVRAQSPAAAVLHAPRNHGDANHQAPEHASNVREVQNAILWIPSSPWFALASDILAEQQTFQEIK
ncbi:hypothetical protein GLOTRDRAFT_132558 [Gloeophyllum trabeum ATCC 11539]|uniref:Uncharacterized protein n=1 Tax=Gloeophyllum trabeum (strain ATCC 11539 / FP-39264 / Madison 617) TaxID=670483 RepID=S7RBW2_GLOTA|nr:uncharacterized protein GLOTRDRAFT_132558 [Gloeophyllum trabeum ATCC 11539]EPQ51740.1 hypothetical protein GLOTRDRAFT_132558 [Gloeophyllum trabeum ATCC 11539]